MNITSIPTRGLVDPARTAAIHAIRISIEDRLDDVLGFVDDHLSGRSTMALADARNTVSEISRELAALQQLGPPMSKHDYYADSL